MADSVSNPVSPKVVAAGLWSVVVPSVVALVLVAIDYFLTSGPSLFPSIPAWVWPILGSVGAIVGGYLKTDPERIPSASEARIVEAVDQLNAPENTL